MYILSCTDYSTVFHFIVVSWLARNMVAPNNTVISSFVDDDDDLPRQNGHLTRTGNGYAKMQLTVGVCILAFNTVLLTL